VNGTPMSHSLAVTQPHLENAHHIFMKFPILVTVLFLISAGAAVGQPRAIRHPELDPCLKDPSKVYRYASAVDKFSIYLPYQTFEHSLLGLGSTHHDSDGSETGWFLCEGAIAVQHFTLKTPVAAGDLDLKKYAAAIREHMEGGRPKIEFVSTSDLLLNGMYGIENIYKNEIGETMIVRAFTDGRDEFLISATVKKDKPDAEKLIRKAIDTFDPCCGAVE
jgi:hypothetical protein